MVQLPLPCTWSVHPPGLRIASPEMVQRGQYVDATRADPAIPRDARVIEVVLFGVAGTASNSSPSLQFCL